VNALLAVDCVTGSVTDDGWDGLWLPAASLDDVQERRQHARALIGLQLAAVRYCEIDYAMLRWPDGQHGVRQVVNEAEWQDRLSGIRSATAPTSASSCGLPAAGCSPSRGIHGAHGAQRL